MAVKNALYNPLTKITGEQWIQLVELLTENVFALNSRILLKIETYYAEGGHYPAIYFRLTTILEDPGDNDPKPETSGFVFGFNNDWDDDVYIHPLSPQGYWEDWLTENEITSVFNYHEVGLWKILSFLEKELNLWGIAGDADAVEYKPNEWNLLKVYDKQISVD